MTFSNNSSQRERQRQLVEDSLLNRAANDIAQEQQGRHRNAHVTVTGTTPSVRYPQGQGPWAPDTPQVPPEPPLGVAIDQQEPTGEAFEVAASMGDASEAPGISEAPLADTSLTLGASPPSQPPGFDQAAPVLRKLVRSRRRSL